MNKSGAVIITANGTRDGVKEAQAQAVDNLSQCKKLELVPILEKMGFIEEHGEGIHQPGSQKDRPSQVLTPLLGI